MEVNKLAVNKGNIEDKVINVQIGRVIKYPMSSTVLVRFQNLSSLSRLFFELGLKLKKNIVDDLPDECQFLLARISTYKHY